MSKLQLDPLLVSIQREGKETRRVEIPDPRNEFCKQWDALAVELELIERAVPLPRSAAINHWAVAIIETSDQGWTPGGDDPLNFAIQFVWAQQLPEKSATRIAGLINKEGGLPVGQFAHPIMQLLANQCCDEAEPACLGGVR